MATIASIAAEYELGLLAALDLLELDYDEEAANATLDDDRAMRVREILNAASRASQAEGRVIRSARPEPRLHRIDNASIARANELSLVGKFGVLLPEGERLLIVCIGGNRSGKTYQGERWVAEAPETRMRTEFGYSGHRAGWFLQQEMRQGLGIWLEVTPTAEIIFPLDRVIDRALEHGYTVMERRLTSYVSVDFISSFTDPDDPEPGVSPE